MHLSSIAKYISFTTVKIVSEGFVDSHYSSEIVCSGATVTAPAQRELDGFVGLLKKFSGLLVMMSHYCWGGGLGHSCCFCLLEENPTGVERQLGANIGQHGPSSVWSKVSLGFLEQNSVAMYEAQALWLPKR